MNATTKNAKELFIAAVKLPAEQQDAFLDQACADAPELRQQVEALLLAYQEAGSFLEKPPVGEVGDTGDIPPGRWMDPKDLAPSPLEGPGTRIGPYKLLQKLGEGGMGAVFLAEQEQPVKRRVALKIIKAGMDSAHVIARFEAERQALALMDHPHIAKVLDAGTTETGRHYFVMELVKGVPITKFSDQEHLTPKERLELFIPVCQAVQHAHQKGIIHRDLKPSNVLIALYDGKPVPKVIDFGVAKATAQKLTERTMFTEVGQIVGTLEYMAPEQAELNNLDIDTRADIYSLGVLLYELLTGSPPFTGRELRSAAFTEMLRMIREVEPPKPSTKLSSSEELPSIAAKRKLEPKKLTKLVHGDLDWIVMKALEKDRGRRYETANGLAVDIQRFLADEPVAAGPPSAGYRLRKFVKRNKGRVAAAGLAAALLVLGAVVSTWQAVRASRAETEARNNEARARDEEQKAHDAAADATAQRNRAEEKERQANTAAKEAKAVLAFFQDKVLAAGRPEGQEGGLGKDVTLRKAVDEAAPKIAAAFPQQPLVEASIRQVLGMTYLHLGEYSLAAQHLKRALALRQAGLGPEHPDTLTSTHNLVEVSLHMGQRQALILSLAEETLARRTAVLGPEHPDTLLSMSLLGIACWGNWDRALLLHETALRLAKAKLAPDHPVTLEIMNGLEQAYKGAGKLDLALPLCEEILERRKAKLGPNHPDTLSALHNLAGCYARAKKPDQAVPLFEQALKKMKTMLGPDHPDTLNCMSNLARNYQAQGKYDREADLLTEKLKLMKAKHGPGHPNLLRTVFDLARAYQATDRHGDAVALYEEALPDYKAKQGLQAPSTLSIMVSLARAYDAMGKYPEAVKLGREALAIRRRTLPADDLTLAGTKGTLGLYLLHAQQPAEAESLLRECLDIFQKKQADFWTTFNVQSWLGGSLLGQQKYAEAELQLVQGYEGLKQREAQIPAQWKFRLTEALERLVQLYDATGQKAKADEWRKQLEAAKPPAKP
jgi:serine/threonine protein kinase